ncbi:DNA-binding response regulator [Hylemonella sp. W303a]|uniref:DNA-binding response regulator n=1 Tax=Hylemonella sp. W303a TaxID=3389873 RepID=UPI00396B36AB
MLSVLVVEDDPQTRDFFARCIQDTPGLSLVGAAATVAAAKAWLDSAELVLDVLLVDLGLPDGSGLDVMRHAFARFPAVDMLVISMFGDEDSVLDSIEAGAVGYIHKDERPENIAQTILQIRAGASPISPMVARRVLRRYRALAEAAPAAPPVLPEAQAPALSTREQAVLELIARGFSYAEIARLQEISVHTVQTHIKNLYQKLAVHSRGEAVFEATRMGLLKSF